MIRDILRLAVVFKHIAHVRGAEPRADKCVLTSVFVKTGRGRRSGRGRFGLFTDGGNDRTVRRDLHCDDIGIARPIAVPVTGRGEGDRRGAFALALIAGGQDPDGLTARGALVGKGKLPIDGVVDDGVVTELVLPLAAGALVRAP